ncbi:SIR2 family protein [Xanthobacter oligotrophicus]|uniref:SIR2 family protein n=2 Tax=Xanthobacter oligotrophicus TaxID=2607286 RepID=UPI0011F2362A|nr:SIR2 family protein [Xanthobacter oligotrophicus]MCG5235311.1 SIR2 family protein [Xanthobacter oligotrophicus]
MTGGAAVTMSMLEVLKKLDVDFADVAKAVENGEFALWVGSGISRNAPSLGGLIERAMEFLRQGAADPATTADFTPAFDEALRIAEAATTDVAPHRGTAFATWPPELRKAIVNRLWDKYSELLDVRVAHKLDDYLLWDGVNVRAAFANPPPPAAEHLAIAILILEGVVQEIASANWDGFIEAAVERLGTGCAGNLQVVVDPDHLRDGAAKARLLKFHGCIVHATQDPDRYRKFLTGSATQINEWANNRLFAPMVGRVTAIATDRKAMMVGLSLQDVNLQQLFAAARKDHPWPWPGRARRPRPCLLQREGSRRQACGHAEDRLWRQLQSQHGRHQGRRPAEGLA